jgi:hypothetical protein
VYAPYIGSAHVHINVANATERVFVSGKFLKKREFSSFLIEVHTSQGFLRSVQSFCL